MATIDITEINQETYQVTVIANGETTHEVSVQTAYAEKLSAGQISTSELIKKSFEFLLERESNTSILRKFDLTIIAHYFPEYEQEISKRF
jgi:hypothetical protein